MTSVLEGVRDYAQNHPISVAAGLIVVLPGTYFYVTGKSLCALGLCSNETTSAQSLMDGITDGLSLYDSTSLDTTLRLPVSKWSDKPSPAPTIVVRVLRGTGRYMVLVLTATGERLGMDVKQLLRCLEERWAPHYPTSRLVSVAIATALPGAFLAFARKHPNSWAARNQTKIANVLHVFALVTVAHQRLSIQDLFVAGFVMMTFEALQRIGHESESPPAVETALLSQTKTTVAATSDMTGSSQSARKHSSSGPEATAPSSSLKDAEIEELHKRIAEFKTAEQAREVDLKRTKADLSNARATLSETFAEYSSLRDELKAMKQSVGRDHQAVIYRKDIELFALRKANEQKENYIKDRDGKLQDIQRQHKAALELRDAELRKLKERIVFLERQASPRFDSDGKFDSATESDGQGALQVKFLRVKGRNSIEIDERTLDEKDNEIAKLKADLASATAASEALNNTQVELRRAWDATAEVQQQLNDEREQHAQTQEKLRDAALKIEEEFKKCSGNNFPGQLPTIDEHDKQELEAMFNTAQQDNSRLYVEVESLEKRVREANARVFMSEQAAEALAEQLKLEKAINEDLETARPSLVHRVHFQRMEGQLNESREELDAKDEEIKKLQQTAAEKEAELDELSKEKDASASAHSKLQEENERLKKDITALEATKEQLMLDHERLARHRARTRIPSAEHASARSSGATLITEPIPIPPIPSDVEPPLPARPISSYESERPSSIQDTPERHLRHDPPNRLSMISNEVPPEELRHSRRRSLTLKGLMRKIARKDEEVKEAKEEKKMVEKPVTTENTRPKTPKDKPTLNRPKTATGQEKEKAREKERPKTAAAPPAKEDKKAEHGRYYPIPPIPPIPDERPKTAGGDEGNSSATKEELRPKSRGWAASRKLVRKSLG